MGNPQVTDFELGWLVGILDGEGCFCLNENSPWKGDYTYYIPHIALVNTKDEIIEEAARILKNLELPFYIQKMTRAKHQKPAKRLVINGFERVAQFTDKLAHLFKCREDQVQTLVEFIALRRSKGEDKHYDIEEIILYKRLRELNKRGN